MLASYKLSLLACVNLNLAYCTVFKPPRLIPAGANHGAATLSLKA